MTAIPFKYRAAMIIRMMLADGPGTRKAGAPVCATDIAHAMHQQHGWAMPTTYRVIAGMKRAKMLRETEASPTDRMSNRKPMVVTARAARAMQQTLLDLGQVEDIASGDDVTTTQTTLAKVL